MVFSVFMYNSCGILCHQYPVQTLLSSCSIMVYLYLVWASSFSGTGIYHSGQLYLWTADQKRREEEHSYFVGRCDGNRGSPVLPEVL